MRITQQLASYYSLNQADSAIIYAQQSVALADNLRDDYTKIRILSNTLVTNNSLGGYNS